MQARQSIPVMASAIALAPSLTPLVSSASPEHPNVVLVMTDDQGYSNLSCVGNPVLKTPNIDKFHDASIRLTNYHVDPTCAPSRSALMTGHYSHRAGVWHTILGRSLLRVREKTMAECFEDSGYATAIFGKWHLGDTYPFRPGDRGFQHRVVLGGGGITQIPDYWGNDYFDDKYRVDGKLIQFKGFCTDVFFDEAMKFIKKSKKAGKPFFVYLVPNACHGPMYCPVKFSRRFLGMEINGIKIDRKIANYYGMIENIDYNFGRLTALLKKEKLYDDTILVFTSDNGPVTKGVQIYNAALRGGKGSHFDGGHRVPFFISYPAAGIDKGIDIDKITAHLDILPTFIDLCHLKAPKTCFDGKSLAPLLLNPNIDWPDRVVVVENQRVVTPEKYRKFAVMTDRWRLTGDKGNFQLYDMSKDRSQKHNVIDEHQELKDRLLAAYETFWKDVSKDDALFTRLVIGDHHENPTLLTGQDWIGKRSAWNQKLVQHGTGCVAHWALRVARDGWFQISLRRWPAEADQPIDAAYVGKKLDINKATIEIQGQKMEKPVPPGAKEITFRIKLKKGKAELTTIFSGPDAKLSAYYAYVARESPELQKDWQTREGLGLPLAKWPEVLGKDTTQYPREDDSAKTLGENK